MQRSQLGLGFGPRRHADRPGALTAAGEARQHFKRRPSGAEPAQHGIEGDRPDRLGAAQPQPVETLLRIEFPCGQGELSLS